ncbi:hypothetical protein AC579_188 [Pseudocercospora musae]|uniref:NmrA-like domain-containing protein n=1 Tax=Pseudocercospora musae TaxID=113226 RepID=A0A139I4M1_9PEZI|nr:hypothetical protein AC579_188 [Pseudocercospora musae]
MGLASKIPKSVCRSGHFTRTKGAMLPSRRPKWLLYNQKNSRKEVQGEVDAEQLCAEGGRVADRFRITSYRPHNKWHSRRIQLSQDANVFHVWADRALANWWITVGNDLIAAKSPMKHFHTKDIGKIAAEAFLHAGSPEYKNMSIPVAGDEISVAEAERVFREVTGQQIPETYEFIARILKWSLHEQLGIMCDWFRTHGFGVDVPQLRKRYPYLENFRAWLETESAWTQ